MAGFPSGLVPCFMSVNSILVPGVAGYSFTKLAGPHQVHNDEEEVEEVVVVGVKVGVKGVNAGSGVCVVVNVCSGVVVGAGEKDFCVINVVVFDASDVVDGSTGEAAVLVQATKPKIPTTRKSKTRALIHPASWFY
jgi:hypothetical protein